MATMSPTRPLKLLDLTEVLHEGGVTEFESLDMAVHMLCLAVSDSHEICRAIALAAKIEGFDGLVYPSYFSLLRTGHMPFVTSYGISHRRVPRLADRERSRSIPNLALFGYPIKANLMKIRSIDRLVLKSSELQISFRTCWVRLGKTWSLKLRSSHRFNYKAKMRSHTSALLFCARSLARTRPLCRTGRTQSLYRRAFAHAGFGSLNRGPHPFFARNLLRFVIFAD